MSPPDENFDFNEFGRQFGFEGFPVLPSGIGEVLLKAIITSSKTMRTLYEEHINNGFDSQQAMVLVLSTQREVLKAMAFVGIEIAKISAEYAQRRAEGGEES